MTPRFTSRFLIDLLIRKASAEGGFATILARGDLHSGGILVQCCDRGIAGSLMERMHSIDGKTRWQPVGPSAESSEEDRKIYLEKRQRIDPDLWIIELDIANSNQFIADWSGIS